MYFFVVITQGYICFFLFFLREEGKAGREEKHWYERNIPSIGCLPHDAWLELLDQDLTRANNVVYFFISLKILRKGNLILEIWYLKETLNISGFMGSVKTNLYLFEQTTANYVLGKYVKVLRYFVTLHFVKLPSLLTIE